MIQHRLMTNDKAIKTNVLMNPEISLFSTWIMSQYGFNSAAFRPVDMYFLELMGLEFNPDEFNASPVTFVNEYHNHLLNLHKTVNVLHQLNIEKGIKHGTKNDIRDINNETIIEAKIETKNDTKNLINNKITDVSFGASDPYRADQSDTSNRQDKDSTSLRKLQDAKNQSSTVDGESSVGRMKQSILNFLNGASRGSLHSSSENESARTGGAPHDPTNMVAVKSPDEDVSESADSKLDPLGILMAQNNVHFSVNGSQYTYTHRLFETMNTYDSRTPNIEFSNRSLFTAEYLNLPMYHLQGMNHQILSQVQSMLTPTQPILNVASRVESDKDFHKDSHSEPSRVFNFNKWMKSAQNYLMDVSKTSRIGRDVFIPSLSVNSVFERNMNTLSNEWNQMHQAPQMLYHMPDPDHKEAVSRAIQNRFEHISLETSDLIAKKLILLSNQYNLTGSILSERSSNQYSPYQSESNLTDSKRIDFKSTGSTPDRSMSFAERELSVVLEKELDLLLKDSEISLVGSNALNATRVESGITNTAEMSISGSDPVEINKSDISDLDISDAEINEHNGNTSVEITDLEPKAGALNSSTIDSLQNLTENKTAHVDSLHIDMETFIAELISISRSFELGSRNTSSFNMGDLRMSYADAYLNRPQITAYVDTPDMSSTVPSIRNLSDIRNAFYESFVDELIAMSSASVNVFSRSLITSSVSLTELEAMTGLSSVFSYMNQAFEMNLLRPLELTQVQHHANDSMYENLRNIFIDKAYQGLYNLAHDWKSDDEYANQYEFDTPSDLNQLNMVNLSQNHLSQSVLTLNRSDLNRILLNSLHSSSLKQNDFKTSLNVDFNNGFNYGINRSFSGTEGARDLVTPRSDISGLRNILFDHAYIPTTNINTNKSQLQLAYSTASKSGIHQVVTKLENALSLLHVSSETMQNELGEALNLYDLNLINQVQRLKAIDASIQKSMQKSFVKHLQENNVLMTVQNANVSNDETNMDSGHLNVFAQTQVQVDLKTEADNFSQVNKMTVNSPLVQFSTDSDNTFWLQNRINLTSVLGMNLQFQKLALNKMTGLMHDQKLSATEKSIGTAHTESFADGLTETHLEDQSTKTLANVTVEHLLSTKLESVYMRLEQKIPDIIKAVRNSDFTEPQVQFKNSGNKKSKHKKRRKTQKSLIDKVFKENHKDLQNILSSRFEDFIENEVSVTILESVMNSKTDDLNQVIWNKARKVIDDQITDMFMQILENRAVTFVNKNLIKAQLKTLSMEHLDKVLSEDAILKWQEEVRQYKAMHETASDIDVSLHHVGHDQTHITRRLTDSITVNALNSNTRLLDLLNSSEARETFTKLTLEHMDQVENSLKLAQQASEIESRLVSELTKRNEALVEKEVSKSIRTHINTTHINTTLVSKTSSIITQQLKAPKALTSFTDMMTLSSQTIEDIENQAAYNQPNTVKTLHINMVDVDRIVRSHKAVVSGLNTVLNKALASRSKRVQLGEFIDTTNSIQSRESSGSTELNEIALSNLRGVSTVHTQSSMIGANLTHVQRTDIDALNIMNLSETLSKTSHNKIESIAKDILTTRRTTERIALSFETSQDIDTNLSQDLITSSMEQSYDDMVFVDVRDKTLSTLVDLKPSTQQLKTKVTRNVAAKITKDIMGHVQRQAQLDISERIIDTAETVLNKSQNVVEKLENQHIITNLVKQEISELENRSIKPVSKDYVRQPAQTAPKLDSKPVERPMETIEIPEPAHDVMTRQLPESNVPAMEPVDIDAIFDKIYHKFEKRIAFEKRRRGM